MKRSIQITLFTVWATLRAVAGGFTGSELNAGANYYLYNVYQAKFLSYGNTWGTQVSLDNSAPLLCTLETNDDGYVVNTHYHSTEGVWSASVDNYLYIADGIPVVNAHWGDPDDANYDRTAQTWHIHAVDEGYTLTLASDDTQALMYGAGTACTVADLSEGYNADKSVWRLVSESEYAAYQAKNRFTVAAMNVDGMPKSITIASVYTLTLNSDAKEEAGATAIGNKLRTMGYDVIGVSEDFNFHNALWDAAWNNGAGGYNATTHRGKISVSASTYTKYLASSSPLFDTDGLCLFYKMANVNADKLTNSESWTAWTAHNGYTDDGADGMIDKGYRYYTVQLEDGTEVDLYILHMDAEVTSADIAARETQLTQLANAILATSNGRPIIVMGDTNCRYTRDRVKTLFIDALNADERFTVKDAWVEFGNNGMYPSCNGQSLIASELGYRKGEVVDKVFYINNTESNIRLTAESYVQDLSFVDETGEPLADHWPCVVEFSYHDYDPAVDDAVEVGTLDGVYLRNVATGYLLKAGGWWGTHAVQGEYGSPMNLVQLPSGKYALQSNIGYLTQGDPYMDGAQADWRILNEDDHYVFCYESDGKAYALTGNDPTYFSYGPNKRYVTTVVLNVQDNYQQWEVLTADDLLDEACYATESNPYDLTFLLSGANFDRNDNTGKAAWTGWPTDATKMTYSLDGVDTGNAFANPVAEVFVNSFSGSKKYETKWTVQQTVTGLPSGHYEVSCQGFYRVNTGVNTSTAECYLTATSGSSTQKERLCNMSDIACNENIGSTTSGGYYYPNSMTEAAAFFNRGYYENKVSFDVSEGAFTLSVSKENDTKSSSVWTCFDNFRIWYYPSETFIPGDLNNDKRVSIADLTLMVNYLSGETEGVHRANSDVDGDHRRNISDVKKLIELIINP